MSVQPFTALDPDTEQALRDSIRRFGVVVPVIVDQQGQVLDGNHRLRIARELGVDCPTKVRKVRDDEDAMSLAFSLNADRRQMSRDQRLEVVADLRSKGYSLRLIAEVTGTSKSQAANDVNELSTTGQLTQPEKSKGADGKERPATRPKSEEGGDPQIADEATTPPSKPEPPKPTREQVLRSELGTHRIALGKWLAFAEHAEAIEALSVGDRADYRNLLVTVAGAASTAIEVIDGTRLKAVQ